MTTNQEPLNLSSFSTFEEKNQETTTNREARRRLLHLRKKLKNDDKSPGLSSFTTPKKTTKR
jgi:hypothetical protein